MAMASATSWERATRRKVDQLRESAAAPLIATQPTQLPAPVARHFRSALPESQHVMRWVTATQRAEFFANGGWRPLTATQHVRINRPGFVWDARIEMAP